ncbi:MAG: hypothetical protein Unbinned2990contig1001_23 [Prokaryotic dsDNA virus sp.]|nr:MAG: hypothetical protein Unbinned2990contig1001_23 [Prokaryotic dsDNA virus sp.]|tara:strand:+ start:8375 stop:8554 length:180 start_codon:yes stop_codon:yes gene_type:complete
MIVLQKGKNKTAPLTREKAQELMNEGGYSVYINKSGSKLVNETAVAKSKATKAKKSKKK